MGLIVFSPHLDDGVLSASAQLARPGATLLTVFGGVPPADTRPGTWDRLTGADRSDRRQSERLAENHSAADVLGCRVETWDELESQYRIEPVDRSAVIARIRAAVVGTDEIWVPAAIGRHPDHVAVREMVMAAVHGPDGSPASDVDGRLRFHADLPYSLQYGWPTWVTGETANPYLDVDGWFRDELVLGGFDPDALTAQVHLLDADVRRLKERAALAYRSQMPALGLGPHDPGRWNAFVGTEVSWAFRPGADAR